MKDLASDLAFGYRQLVRNPKLGALVVLILGIGIGLDATMYSVMNAFIGPPLPPKVQERFVKLSGTYLTSGGSRQPVSEADFLDWKRESRSIEEMSAYSVSRGVLDSSSELAKVEIQSVSEGFFRLMEVQPFLGRAFLSEEMKSGQGRVVILGEGFWRRAFGGDPAVLGKAVTLNGQDRIIVGVMPAGFYFPARGTDLWTPLLFDTAQADRSRRTLWVIGRLKRGVSWEQVQTEMTTIARRSESVYPDSHRGWGVQVSLLRDESSHKLQYGMIMLMGPVIMVMVIACANVANLLLALAVKRQHEMAVRVAVGAGRSRLVRQLLTESTLLGLLGGALGLLLVYGGQAYCRKVLADIIPSVVLRVDNQVLFLVLLLSVLTPVVFGLAPAIYGTRVDVGESLKAGKGTGTKTGSRRFREWLVVIEMILVVIPLALFGIFASIWTAMNRAQPGFDTRHLLVLSVLPSETRYPRSQDIALFYQRLLLSLESLPGVDSVALADNLPIYVGYGDPPRQVTLESRPNNPVGVPVTELAVNPSFFKTMRIPLLRGRYFTEQDTDATIISGAMARRCWPNQDPIGQRFALNGPKGDRHWVSVTGVVDDVIDRDRILPPVALVYRLERTPSQRGMSVVVRTLPDPTTLQFEVKRAMRAMDREQEVEDVMTMQQVLAQGAREYDRMILIFGACSVLAIILAAGGAYSVMSYTVAQRTQEFGIRMALGARSWDILSLVLRQGMTLVSCGLGVGLVGAWIFAGIWIYNLPLIRGVIEVVFLGVTLLLFGVSLLACYLPARRAAIVDPMVSLRQE